VTRTEAINIAVACVMGSHLGLQTKREVIDTLRRLEQEDPVYQAIRDFTPTADQQLGYDALVAWLEATTPFRLDLDEEADT